MSALSLAFFWHQHQPYYPDDVAGTNPMPWVRLHGVKDYYGMALQLLEFPEMCCTINLVPSLLVQLQGYTERGATDQFLDAARIPATALSEAEAIFLLDHNFMANQKDAIWTMYRRHFGIPDNQNRPDDTSWTGAEIRSCCRLAALLDVPLTQAAHHVVPVAVTAAESVEKLRNWASGRCLSASGPGIFQRDGATPKPGRKIQRGPSNN